MDRIVNTLDIVRAGRGESHLVVSEGGAWAISQLLLAKHHMTVQVYKHRARAISDAMIVRAVELAVQEGVPGVREVFTYDGSPKALDRYLTCDDKRLFQMILEGRGARRSKEYCRRLAGRRLLKQVFRKNISEIENALLTNKLLRLSRDEVLRLERQIGRLLEKDPSMVILDVQDISNPTYRSPGFEIHEDDIMVKRRDGAIVKIQAIADVITVPKEKKQTHISVYSERDGVAPPPSDRGQKRLEGKILEILEQIAR
jgi:HD superfamily phosphohydrolase